MPCPRCRHDNPPAAKFCLECGQRLPSGCPSCGYAVAAGAKFCVECGTSLAPAAAAVAPESYTPRHLADKILRPGRLHGARRIARRGSDARAAHAARAAYLDEARAALDLASADLPDAMRAGFRASAVYRRVSAAGDRPPR